MYEGDKNIMPNSRNDKERASLSMNTLSDVPTPNANAQRITALKKDGGRVTGYQLDDGRVLEKDEAVALARQGGIAGVGIAHRNGSEYLKSLPDGAENNDLDSLPSITE